MGKNKLLPEPIKCEKCGKIHGYKLQSCTAKVQDCSCMEETEKRLRAIEFELERLSNHKKE